MRAYVFTDASLKRHAGQFVWLAINGEKAVNAPFRRKYPIAAWPTYYVIDPVREKIATSWVGGATVSQLHQFYDEQSTAYAKRLKGPALNRADMQLALADSLYASNDFAPAAAAYGAALAAAPRGWSPYRRAVEARLFALSSADSAEACADLALAALPNVRRTPSAANVAGSGLGCATALPAAHPRRASLMAAFEAVVREVVVDSTLELSGDDRSGLWIALLDAHPAETDSIGHHAAAEGWAASLERDAARAKTADERAVFDPHRLSAYIELGHPERAIPMLEASEKALPDDYNPPARLAIAYKELKRWDEAIAASDRAMAKAYGPRKLLYFQTRADIYVGRGDKDAARRTLEQAVAYAEALPEGQRSERSIASLKKKIDALSAAPAAPAH